MTLAILAYFAVALGTLIALARMILLIGSHMGDCPQTGRTARAAATSIAAGFLAIGMGGVILIAAAIPAVDTNDPVALGVLVLLTAGFASLILGLGFAHALRTLRVIMRDALRPVVTATTEPVLA
jgi:hypothetical protein